MIPNCEKSKIISVFLTDKTQPTAKKRHPANLAIFFITLSPPLFFCILKSLCQDEVNYLKCPSYF